MMMRFLACLVAFAPVAAYAADANPSQSSQAASLDQEIKQFKAARDRASMQAYIAGNKADQFLGQNWVDYQQAIRQQEMYQQQVKVLDEKIAELEKQRAAVQKGS